MDILILVSPEPAIQAHSNPIEDTSRQGDLEALPRGVALQKRTRQIKKPTRYGLDEFLSYALISIICQLPAMQTQKWSEAMQEEYNSLSKNETLDLVPLPKGAGCKWAQKEDPQLGVKFKARLVAKGFSQKEGLMAKEIQAILWLWRSGRGSRKCSHYGDSVNRALSLVILVEILLVDLHDMRM